MNIDKQKASQEILKALVYIFFGILVALAMFYFSDSSKKDQTNQQSTSTAPARITNPEWSSQIDAIRTALGKKFNDTEIEEIEPISISKRADITGDGIEEALVSIGSGGAYSEYFALMMFKDGKPVPAKFKTMDGKTGDVLFIEGSSVSHGMSTELVPSKTVIYSQSWNVNAFDTVKVECEIEAYQWNASTTLFEYNKTLSKSAGEAYCKKLTQTTSNKQ